MAPGSKVVTDYYEKAGLWPYLEKLGFHLVGYGCTTCIGNSGPLPRRDRPAINDERPRRRLGALRQPQLRGPDQPRRQDELPRLPAARHRVRARRDDGLRLRDRAARHAPRTAPRSSCEDIWPEPGRGRGDHRRDASPRRCSPRTTPTSSPATSAGGRCRQPEGNTFAWDAESTYVRKPPYFDGMAQSPSPVTDIAGARVLAKLGDSVTTDHISPAGAIKADSPAGTLPRRARRRAQGLQLLRLAPRQPRGDDPRHLRQHPAAQPAARRRRGRLHPQLPRGRRADVDLRRGAGLPAGRASAGRPRRQGVRLGLLARLGGQGHRAARGAGRHRRVLRAHPPLEPHRDGRAAAAVPARARPPSRSGSTGTETFTSPGSRR